MPPPTIPIDGTSPFALASQKYKPFSPIHLPDRTWPNTTITQAPIWCSVDLRGGNQALVEPMNGARKLSMFNLLVKMGFKEIEVGFPAASATDFNFCRELIEEGHIPDDVSIQVLVPARKHLVDKTFKALSGAKKAIIQLYCPLSTLHRQVVFKKDRDAVKAIATDGAKMVADRLNSLAQTDLQLEYGAEGFAGTEPDYALEVFEAITDIWQPTPDKKVILNLPATVELATPNIYADQIEWLGRQLSRRESLILSLFVHNDRGTAVAAAELGLLAGADRIEGTLFGNGERAGNIDIITLGLNMYTQGVYPQLDLSDMSHFIDVAEYCNQLPVHQRHPYGGALVTAAFAGSHQDAIRKAMDEGMTNSKHWQIPYLPFDPRDIGRNFTDVIRVNSQSGKGGIAYLLETHHQIRLPKKVEIELSNVVQKFADTTGKEISSDEIYNIFSKEYLENDTPFSLSTLNKENAEVAICYEHMEHHFKVSENMSIVTFISEVGTIFGLDVKLTNYGQMTRSITKETSIVAYVELLIPSSSDEEKSIFGIGIDTSAIIALIKATVSALNRI